MQISLPIDIQFYEVMKGIVFALWFININHWNFGHISFTLLTLDCSNKLKLEYYSNFKKVIRTK